VAYAVVRVRPREPVPELRLRQALEAFDRARSWNARRAACEDLLTLGPEVLASVLAELSRPQPPDRFDAIEELLLHTATLDELIEQALAEGATVDLRASLATALGHAAGGEEAKNPLARERIVAALVHLARDVHEAVRVAAVEALGIAGLGEARAELERIAAGDSVPAVQREARASLDELS
jgi:hypothetical protein